MDKFERMPKDILQYLAISLDLPEILALYSTSKKFNKYICQKELFWMNKLIKDFDINIEEIPIRYKYKNYYEYILRIKRQLKSKEIYLNTITEDAIKSSDLALLNIVIKDGEDKDYALNFSSALCNFNFVKFLSEKGADIHNHNEAPLRIAARTGCIDIVKFFIRKGADIHANGEQALIEASYNGELDVVKYLVEGVIVDGLRSKGADISVKNYKAIRYAKKEGENGIVKYLKSKK